MTTINKKEIYRVDNPDGRPVFGIINPWPGDKSAEAEVLTRMKRAAKENHIGYIMLDNFGHVLNEDDQKATTQYVNAKELDFVITTHYESPKILDAFHYHTVWNPPEIPLNLDYYTERVTNNYLMNDDYLIYDNGGMSNHLRGILMNKPRALEGASSLTASFPKSAMLEPKLENPKMFYCGMNWEKVVSNSNRHEGLFKLLDKTKNVKFFGPEKVEAWGGLRPWDGYDCYQCSIPFDGFSILKEINDCGICLVLSSDIHRRAGAATNRTYEACTAGAVMISDDNEFMLKHFGDAALFINYNKENPQDTFRQIMEKYEWICAHPQEALDLAKRAQEIFREKFTLDAQLESIIANHPARKAQIAKDLYARDCSKTVLVTYVCNTQKVGLAKEWLDKICSNVENQLYTNITLAIGADPRIADELQAVCKSKPCHPTVFTLPLFDQKGVRAYTDGQAIRAMQKECSHDYYMNTTVEEEWFRDHVTTLIRTMEDEGTLCACSGTAHEDAQGYRRVTLFQNADFTHLFVGQHPNNLPAAGQFIFSAKAHDWLPDFLFDCLDGKEHYAYANMIHYKHHQPISFSKRLTLVYTTSNAEKRNAVLDIWKQQRFIQDLVRFDLPEGGGNGGLTTVGGGMKGVADMFQLMPLKSWLKLRYYRWRMRKMNTQSEHYKKLQENYNAVMHRYYEYWGL